MKNKIGVVTVTYNSADVLDDFLDSVNTQTYKDFLLYVIDNDSKDDTAEIIGKVKDKRIVYIQNNENVGVAAANNQGIKHAFEDGCDFVLFLNNDTLFADDTFEKLLQGLKEYKADIVVPKMYYFDDREMIWFAGGDFDKTFQCDVNHIGFKEKDMGQYDEVKEITYAPTCCMLVTKETIDDVGLMDEKYFVYEDDVDFCYRATIQQKKKMICMPDFQFYHKVGGLTNKEGNTFKSDFAMKYAIRNKVYMCKKYFSLKKGAYISQFLIRENLKILFQKKYKRSWHSFILLNKSFFSGLFHK